MKEVKGLKPFGKFIMTIGQLPASYLVSMTYEEQLIWLCNYLQNVVIPTVNNNGEAVEELQNLFIELKDYVDNYFENLDVQEEINNKLDEMAESGELAEIIATFLDVGVLFVYDTALDLAGAENLNDGASAYILGKETYNDGKGAFYKIRELQNTDTPDGDNIITLTETVNLVAEKLPNYRLNEIENTLETLTETTIPAIQDDINTINNTTIPAIEDDIEEVSSDGMILIGDSYLYGQGLVDRQTQNYGYLLKNKLGYTTNFFSFPEPGSGFLAAGNDSHTFKTLLESHASDIEDKNLIKKIVVCGGTNDGIYSTADLITAIGAFVTYCKTTYPNAKVYVGMIGGSNNANSSGTRENIKGNALPAYKRCYEVNATYLNGVENVMQNYKNYYQVDNVHPNADGQEALANAIFQALTSGYFYYYSSIDSKVLAASSGMTESTVYFNERIHDDEVEVVMNGGVTFSSNIVGNFSFDTSVLPAYLRQTSTSSEAVGYARIANTGFAQVATLPIKIKMDATGSAVRVILSVIPSSVTNPRIILFDNLNLRFYNNNN